MPDFLIAQRYTTSDSWTLFIGGSEHYSNSSLDGVLSYLRMQPQHDLPPSITVAIRPLAETEDRPRIFPFEQIIG